MDLAQIGVTDVDRLKSNTKIRVVTRDGIQPIYLVPNLDKPYFKDKRVRQGFMQALPRQQIVTTALAGQASVPLTYPFGPAWAIGPNLNPYDFDAAKAKQLLADGGWDFDRTVTIDLVPGPKDRERVLDIVAGQLQAVGIKLQVRLLQAGPFLQARKDGSFDLSMSGGEIGDIDPALMFVAVRCGGYYKDGKGTNFANYCNEQLDNLFLQGQQTTVQAERATFYKQATQIMNEDMPYLLLYAPKTLYAVSARLQGFKPNGDFTHAYWNAGDWSISQ
jgi:peptide/nickel transport system substrate-binding protein